MNKKSKIYSSNHLDSLVVVETAEAVVRVDSRCWGKEGAGEKGAGEKGGGRGRRDWYL